MPDIAALVRDLESFRTRPAAKAELLKQGTAAVPALVEALQHPSDSVRWVAARALGEIASPDAEAALREAARLPGMEIVCADALEAVAPRSDAQTRAASHTADPLTVIREALNAAHFVVSDAREGLEVTVTLPTGRSQRVLVAGHMKDSEGREYVQFRTACGPARSDAYEWALRQNAKTAITTIGIVDTNPPGFVMTRNVYRDSIHHDEVVRTVMGLAANGDVFEKALTKEDKR